MYDTQMTRRKIVLNGLAWATLGTLAAPAMAQGPPPAPFVTHQLKPNIYWIEGGGGNSTVIIGTNGVIVVDAKTTMAGGQELLADIAKITPKLVTTVILTHSDGDHVNGLAAFPAGIKIIAHENNKKEQEAALAAGGRGAPPADHQPTQVITKNKETLTIEGEKIELYHWAPAHTSGDLIVYLPKDKIVATGDIIATSNPYPRIHDEKNGSTEGWIHHRQRHCVARCRHLHPWPRQHPDKSRHSKTNCGRRSQTSPGKRDGCSGQITRRDQSRRRRHRQAELQELDADLL